MSQIVRVAAIGCSHSVFCNSDRFAEACKIIRDHKPHYVVHLGDLYEGLAGSKHPEHPEYADIDMDNEHDHAEQQIKEINEAARGARKIWLYGNHDCNVFNLHADRLAKRIHKSVHWRRYPVAKALEGWHVVERYGWAIRAYIGQFSFGHGVQAGVSAGKNEAYDAAVAGGLDVLAHTHRPEPVTQARERKNLLPFWHCNVGSLADFEKMHYADRFSRRLWGAGVFLGECDLEATGQVPQWSAEVKVLSRGDYRPVVDMEGIRVRA